MLELVMDPVRILYARDGHLWSFTSPDVPGLIGARQSPDEAQAAAEEAVYMGIELAAEEAGRPVPSRESVPFVHYFEAADAAALVASAA